MTEDQKYLLKQIVAIIVIEIIFGVTYAEFTKYYETPVVELAETFWYAVCVGLLVFWFRTILRLLLGENWDK